MSKCLLYKGRYHIGTAVKHLVPDCMVKPSFVIFDIRALWRPGLSVRVPGCQKLQMTAKPGLAQDAVPIYGNSFRQRVNLMTKTCDWSGAVPCDSTAWPVESRHTIQFYFGSSRSTGSIVLCVVCQPAITASQSSSLMRLQRQMKAVPRWCYNWDTGVDAWVVQLRCQPAAKTIRESRQMIGILAVEGLSPMATMFLSS